MMCRCGRYSPPDRETGHDADTICPTCAREQDDDKPTRPRLDVTQPITENCFVRRARKDYRCQAGRHRVAGCAQQIAAGDYYVECCDSTPPFQTGDRYCLACAADSAGPLGGVIAEVLHD